MPSRSKRKRWRRRHAGGFERTELDRSDLALIRKAIVNNWKITGNARFKLPGKVLEVLESEAGITTKLAAIKTLRMMADGHDSADKSPPGSDTNS